MPSRSLSARSLVCGLLFASTALPGCKKPTPKLTTPVEVQAPQLDSEALAATQAASEGKSGSVKLEYCVGEDGTTHDVTVAEPFDPEVDALAVKTVEGWTFRPATRDGTPYDFCTDVTIEIRLEAPEEG